MLKKGLTLPFRLVLRILISPFVVFIVGLIYYGDTKEAYYLALLFYTALTVFSLITTFITISMSMAKFRVFKLIRKSYKVISMLIALGIYWAIYLVFWA